MGGCVMSNLFIPLMAFVLLILEILFYKNNQKVLGFLCNVMILVLVILDMFL